MTRLRPEDIVLADEETIALCRLLTGEQKRQIASRLFEAHSKRVWQEVRVEHPGYSEAELRCEVLYRVQEGSLDRATCRRACGLPADE